MRVSCRFFYDAHDAQFKQGVVLMPIDLGLLAAIEDSGSRTAELTALCASIASK